MWRTPAAPAAPSAARPAFVSPIRIAARSEGGWSPTSSRKPVRCAARSSSERHAGTTSTKRNSAARSSSSCAARSIARSSSALSGWPRWDGNASCSARPTRWISASSVAGASALPSLAVTTASPARRAERARERPTRRRRAGSARRRSRRCRRRWPSGRPRPSSCRAGEPGAGRGCSPAGAAGRPPAAGGGEAAAGALAGLTLSALAVLFFRLLLDRRAVAARTRLGHLDGVAARVLGTRHRVELGPCRRRSGHARARLGIVAAEDARHVQRPQQGQQDEDDRQDDAEAQPRPRGPVRARTRPRGYRDARRAQHGRRRRRALRALARAALRPARPQACEGQGRQRRALALAPAPRRGIRVGLGEGVDAWLGHPG